LVYIHDGDIRQVYSADGYRFQSTSTEIAGVGPRVAYESGRFVLVYGDTGTDIYYSRAIANAATPFDSVSTGCRATSSRPKRSTVMTMNASRTTCFIGRARAGRRGGAVCERARRHAPDQRREFLVARAAAQRATQVHAVAREQAGEQRAIG
jgi:hypothetical protein